MRQSVLILIALGVAVLVVIAALSAPVARLVGPAATTPTRVVYMPAILKPEPPTPTTAATVTPTVEPTQVPGLPQFVNSGFEAGHQGWVEIPGNALITQFPPFGVTPHTGQWLAWLGGTPNDDDELQQAITLPTGSPLYLHFFDQIRQGNDDFDRFVVYVNTTIVVNEDIDLGTETGGMWEERVVDLNPYAGQTVTIRFFVRIRNSVAGSVFLDDISIQSHP